MKSGRDAVAGDVVIRRPDWVIGTDASSPMAIAYFERMGGERLFDPARVLFSLDHYAPPTTPQTIALHERVRAFAARYGATVLDVGEGISHQVIGERGDARPGMLLIGADSHTVTCGALNLFSTGIGSSDLAAAMITGEVWLRVPDTIAVTFVGTRPADVAAKDVALALVGELGAEGANYLALEFRGPSVAHFTLEDRLVISNLAVEAGAKAAIFPTDDQTLAYLAGRTSAPITAVDADPGARYVRELTVDLGTLSPRVSLPMSRIMLRLSPPSSERLSTWCSSVRAPGGRVSDIHTVVDVLNQGGGHVAPGVQLVVTPASAEVQQRLTDDGTLDRLRAMGAVITTPGCGACCGTSGVIPGPGATVLSTANRNFQGRMGSATASIYLASPVACAAAALTGQITDPATVRTTR